MRADEKSRQESMILDLLEGSFGDVRLGNSMNLEQAHMYLFFEDAEDIEAAASDVYSGSYREVPIEHVEEFPCALNGLDVAGFRFFIPLCIRWFILRHEATESFADERLLYSLNLHEEVVIELADRQDELHSFKKERFLAFDFAQSVAIARFLEYASRYAVVSEFRETAAQALETYWSRFLVDDPVN